MIIVVGEILIDVFDHYQRIGGAPFNFAFHLKQLGLPVRLLTRIGDDRPGQDILDMLERHGFDPRDVQIDSRHPTGTVRVTLDDQGVPQFDIRTEVAYDHLDLSTPLQVNWRDVRMVYFGTLVQRTAYAYHEMKRFLDAKPQGTEAFCDINLRPPHFRHAAVATALQHADILKLNTDELAYIQAAFGGPLEEAHLVEWILQRFALRMLLLTRGAQGSTMYTTGETLSAAPPDNKGAIVDTVGAGDAYAAIVAAGNWHGLPMCAVMEMASEFAACICGQSGAVPENNAVYESLLRKMEGIRNGRKSSLCSDVQHSRPSQG
jgi:fructokinase